MKRTMHRIFIAATVLLMACSGADKPSEDPDAGSDPIQQQTITDSEEADMKLTSTAFDHQDTIPRRYTCDGRDISPPLQFTDVPAEAATLALVMEDPDAPSGTFVHWVCYNMPATIGGLDEGITASGIEGTDMLQGVTGFHRNNYGGPCPPSRTHRYVLHLYALDAALPLEAGATTQQLRQAMDGHILAEAELLGFYTRDRQQ
jgi:Raf kinase inhibitor-like YbhB/YbcL family protein